ncbi:MAG: MarR family winged helix-turn-helix transcriptional regulator, partial [Cellulophaga baltica]
EKGLIIRKPNPNDGRGVLIHLTPFGLEKRVDSKNVVLRFNEVVKDNVQEDHLNGFFEVMDTINKLVIDKKIYTKDSKTI